MLKLGLKGTINFAIVAAILLTSTCIVVFSWKKSSRELSRAVENGNMDLVHATASDIFNVNDREFKMLESLANLSYIRDPEVDLHDKWKLINSATGGSAQYLGMAIYNEKGIGWTTTEKWSDLHDREYLAVSMKGQRAIMDPNWSPVNGNLSTFYAHPVYDASKKQIAEVVAVLDSTELCRTVAGIKVGNNSHPYVINIKTGKFVAHSDVEVVKEGKSISDEASAGFKPVIEAICRGESGTAVYYDEVQRKKFSAAYQPVPGCDWAVVCAAPYQDFYSGTGELLRSMIFISLVALVIAFVIGKLVMDMAIKPLRRVSSAIDGIAIGDADLTHLLTVTSKDEIGELSKGFNFFTEKLQAIITELKKSKNDLYAYGEQLGGMVQSNANSLNEMISSIKYVNEEIKNQHNKVDSSVTAVSNISAAVEQLRALLQKQTDGVEQASIAVTQMIGSINSVSSSVEQMASEFTGLQLDVDKGITQQREVNKQIQQIEIQSKTLNEANKVIASIASQTNLLAMNAAIEAAHAGEAGKGFAVVADEIRKLSETSSSESKKISTQLRGILGSISSVVQASDMSDKSFSVVAEKIQDTGNLVSKIKFAMDEQSQGSKKIGTALSYMNDATEQVRVASDGVDKSRQGIIGDVTSLKQSSDSVKEHVENMEGNIKRIEEDDNALLNIATSINGSIYRISSQIDRFKV